MTKVSIKDANSLHGTYVNKVQLDKNERRQIHTGDILTFGMTVDRGATQYHPFQVEANISFGTGVYVPHESGASMSPPWLIFTHSPSSATVTYKVPDESEIEDISSDEEEVQMLSTEEMGFASNHLRENGIRPAKECFASIDRIDLTSDNGGSTANDQQQPRGSTAEPIPAQLPLATSQEYFIDLTQSLNDFDNDFHDEQTALVQTDHMTDDDERLDDDEVDDEVDYDDEEDDMDWGEDESVPNASDSSDESDASDLSEQQGFPHSDETLAPKAGDEHHDEGAAIVAKLSTDLSPRLMTLIDSEHRVPTLPPYANVDVGVGRPLDEINILNPATTSAPAYTHSNASRDLNAYNPAFFQAREENQRQILGQKNQYESRYPPVAPPVAPSVALPPVPPIALFPPHESAASSSGNHLVASSLNFLSSPPKEELPTPVPEDGVQLDDTSAYRFELSKQEAYKLKRILNSPEAKKSPLNLDPFHDMLNAHNNRRQHGTVGLTQTKEDGESTPTLNDSVPELKASSDAKRKIDDISRTTPEEERWASAQKGAKHLEPMPSHAPSDSTPALVNTPSIPMNSHVCPVPHLDHVRPVKRLRRAAEVFGYVALGGVAVMSALIATAPAL